MIDYNEDWLLLLLFKHKGSVFGRALLTAVPAACFAFFLRWGDENIVDFRREHNILDDKSSVLWAASTAVLLMMLGVRTNRAISRFWEGTGLLHQMRGEWFDSVSCCVTFSTVAMDTLSAEVREFRHTIVRLMSLCHASALEEIAGDAEQNRPLMTIDWVGLSDETLEHLKRSRQLYNFNRVEMLLHMTQTLIVKAHANKVLNIPAPILTRVFQTLSRGFVNLLNAKKITDTYFPFPYAQLLSMLLLLHVVLTPMMISCLVYSKPWAMVFSFLPVFGTFCLNYVAIELENPFGADDNDLPLFHFQKEMNKCLLMLLEDHADMPPTVHQSRCLRTFREIDDKLKLDTAMDTEADPLKTHASTRISLFDFEGGSNECFSTDSTDSRAFGSQGSMSSSTLATAEEPAPAAGGVAVSSSSAASPPPPGLVARHEAPTDRRGDTIEKKLARWTIKADDHSEVVRQNTDAIYKLVDKVPSMQRSAMNSRSRSGMISRSRTQALGLEWPMKIFTGSNTAARERTTSGTRSSDASTRAPSTNATCRGSSGTQGSGSCSTAVYRSSICTSVSVPRTTSAALIDGLPQVAGWSQASLPEPSPPPDTIHERLPFPSEGAFPTSGESDDLPFDEPVAGRVLV